MDKQKEIIELILKTILTKLTIEGKIDIIESAEYPQFVIRTQEAGLLIGENGQHLFALNHLVKKIVDSEIKKAGLERLLFLLDVNDYQAKRIEELKNLAKMSAQRVRYFKKEIELDPMTAFDRRIVHSALTEYLDILTESTGDGLDRRVVIKFYE